MKMEIDQDTGVFDELVRVGARMAREEGFRDVVSVLVEAKRAFEGGKRVRAVALIAIAALAWKWTVLGMAAQGVVKLLRR